MTINRAHTAFGQPGETSQNTPVNSAVPSDSLGTVPSEPEIYTNKINVVPSVPMSPVKNEGAGVRFEGGIFAEYFLAGACCQAFAEAAAERAAILEFEAGFSRADADRRGRMMTAACPPCRCEAAADCI